MPISQRQAAPSHRHMGAPPPTQRINRYHCVIECECHSKLTVVAADTRKNLSKLTTAHCWHAVSIRNAIPFPHIRRNVSNEILKITCKLPNHQFTSPFAQFGKTGRHSVTSSYQNANDSPCTCVMNWAGCVAMAEIWWWQNINPSYGAQYHIIMHPWQLLEIRFGSKINWFTSSLASVLCICARISNACERGGAVRCHIFASRWNYVI